MNRVRVLPRHAASRYQQLVAQHETPLFVIDLDHVRQQYFALTEALPEVELFYAIKSLPNLDVVQTLRDAGASFDLATTGEIDLVRQLGLSRRQTLHSHPIKRKKDIEAALRFGCTTFVIDNLYELEKFRPFRHRVGLLVRVGFKNPDAVCDLARKFGCRLDEVPALLEQAEQWGIHIKGLSFHVGSQCEDAKHHAAAIRACNAFIRMQREQHERWLSVLDIGGGFPADYAEKGLNIFNFCAPIREALAELPSRVRVCAEPGRVLSAAAGMSISRVMGKAQRNDGKFWYFLDDGVYGSFSGMIYDHAHYPISVFSDSGSLQPSVLAGPTCDSIDVIADDIELPELEIGDIVVAEQMGAYSLASATDFNLFDRAKVVSFDSALSEQQLA